MRPRWSTFDRGQVALQSAFEVVRLVLVNDVLLGESVNHGSHLGEVFRELLLIRGRTELPKRIAHGFVVVPVAETLGLIGTDALEG